MVHFLAGARDSSFLQYFETVSETSIHCVPEAFARGLNRLTAHLIQMPSLLENGAVPLQLVCLHGERKENPYLDSTCNLYRESEWVYNPRKSI